MKMTSSQELLLNSITQFYDKRSEDRHTIHQIVQGNYKISLRVIDWFITHYSKKKSIILWLDASNGTLVEKPNQLSANIIKFHLYLEYRAQLKSYTKVFFDPFRRHARISFLISKKPIQTMETTIGQLNFFRWIFQHHILEYIEAHLDEIEEEMAKFQSGKKDGGVMSPPEPEPSKKKKVVRSVIKNIPNTFLQTPCYLRFD